MRIRALAAVVCSLMVGSLMQAGSATAATVVGNECTANQGLTTPTLSLSGAPTNPHPSAVPSAGVITSWSVNNAFVEPVPWQKLKVFRPTAIHGQVTVVGESSLQAIAIGSNTFPTRIPVKAGDLIGLSGYLGVPTFPGSIYCWKAGPGNVLGWIEGDPPTGSVVTVQEEVPESASPATVAVEPDADADGYGDETQDRCPTDASTHEACPISPGGGGGGSTPSGSPPSGSPAPTPTLRATAIATKRLAIVDLTSSAQATVTVGGSVKLGKAKPTKLIGETKTVAPAVLARFTVSFPAKVKTALKQLPRGKKLTLRLWASAPEATTTNLTVKVPGQLKPPPRHPRK